MEMELSSRYPRVDLAKTEHRAQRIVGATNMAWRKTALSEDHNDVEVDHTEREHQAEMLTHATAFEPLKSDVHSSELCLDCSRNSELSKD